MKKRRGLDWNLTLSAGENAHRELPVLAREFFVLGRTAAKADASPVELHAFRLSAKRFRYTLELFTPMYGPGLKAKIELVRKIQGILGDRQDCAVLCERLKRHDRAPGPLHETLLKLSEKGRGLEEKFRRHWHDVFDAEGAEAAWMRYLSRAPIPPRPRAASGDSAVGGEQANAPARRAGAGNSDTG